MLRKVVPKKAMNPRARAMRALAKSPKSPMGTPKIVTPARLGPGLESRLAKGPELLAGIADI
jgi:hypothetical protein